MCSVLGVFCVYDWSGVAHRAWLQLTMLTLFEGLPLFLSACSWAKNIFCLCDNRINGLVLIAVEHARSSCFWMPQTTIIQWQSNSGPGAGLKRSHLVLSYIALYFEKAVLSFHCTTHSTLLYMLYHPLLRRMAHILWNNCDHVMSDGDTNFGHRDG